jgi:hypothetical protein
MTSPKRIFAPVFFVALLSARAASLGDFTNESDIGNPRRAGSAEFDSAKHTFRITGGGKNMWATNDAFHFVWKKVSGDVTLTADVALQGKSSEPHRKACLIIRQSLDPDSAYVDVALHGDGSAALQFREKKGDITRTVPAKTNAPVRLQISYKRGWVAESWLGNAGGELKVESSINVKLTPPFYVGLGVCAHNDDALETAVFSNVKLTESAK